MPHPAMPRFSIKALLIVTTAVAVATVLTKWLLGTSPQLAFLFVMGAAVALVAGAFIGAGIGSAYGKTQRGVIVEDHHMLTARLIVWASEK